MVIYLQGKVSVTSLIEVLDGIKLRNIAMTSRSLCLLGLSPNEHEAFAVSHKDSPLKRQVRNAVLLRNFQNLFDRICDSPK